FHKKFRLFLLKQTDVKILSDKDKDFIMLFAHIVGGLFDVDRIDYLERDSKHAGVSYGLVEGERIPKALVPILFTDGKSTDSGLITKNRMVHALDHFLVCLFEMYKQLYKHPSYEGFQHEIGRVIDTIKTSIPQLKIGVHENHVDFNFFALVDKSSDGLFMRLIDRRCKEGREVFQKYGDASIQTSSSKGFIQIGKDDREMIKDDAKIWLIDKSVSETNLIPWNKASLVSSKLANERYNPQIWWKNP